VRKAKTRDAPSDLLLIGGVMPRLSMLSSRYSASCFQIFTIENTNDALRITIFRGLDAGAAVARGSSRGWGMEKGADETHQHCDGLGTRFGFIDVKKKEKDKRSTFSNCQAFLLLEA
jgi:hypothetical protein